MRRHDLEIQKVPESQNVENDETNESLEDKIIRNMTRLKKSYTEVSSEIEKNILKMQNSESKEEKAYLKGKLFQLIRRKKLITSDISKIQAYQLYFSIDLSEDLDSINFLADNKKVESKPITSLSLENSESEHLFDFSDLLDDANSINEFIKKPFIKDPNENIDQQFDQQFDLLVNTYLY